MKDMTMMENAVMNMTGCTDRTTANLVANAILNIEKDFEGEKRIYSPSTENHLRSNIINSLFESPKLGADYIDWHSDEGKCGLTLTFGNNKFDIIITKQDSRKV